MMKPLIHDDPLFTFLAKIYQEITKMSGGRPKSVEGKNKKRQNKRNANRKALRDARNLALLTGTPEENIDPHNAMQFILDRATHMLTNAIAGVENLQPDEVWRETMVGKIPNEWIRLEEDLRKEVWAIAGKMISLGIDDRKARAAEIMAQILAPVLAGILKDLALTPEQEERAPEVVEAHLKVLEATNISQSRRMGEVARGKAA